MSELLKFIERQANIWDDLETVEAECLSGNETISDWLQAELGEVAKLARFDSTRALIAELCVMLIDQGASAKSVAAVLKFYGVAKEDFPPEVLAYLEMEGE